MGGNIITVATILTFASNSSCSHTHCAYHEHNRLVPLGRPIPRGTQVPQAGCVCHYPRHHQSDVGRVRCQLGSCVANRPRCTLPPWRTVASGSRNTRGVVRPGNVPRMLSCGGQYLSVFSPIASPYFLRCRRPLREHRLRWTATLDQPHRRLSVSSSYGQ